MSFATYEMCVDWDDDGDFLDTGEDVSSKVKWPVGFERGFEDQLRHPQAATLEMRLVDTDGKYSPENSSSPLYPNVEIGRKVRLRANYNSTWYDLFHGRISKIIPHPHPTEQIVYLYCVDGMNWLALVDICTELYIQKTENYIINDILDEAGWPSGAANRDIDDNVDTLYGTTLFGLWWHHVPALRAIQDFENITRGRFYITHEGKARWEDRLTRSGKTSAHTFNDVMQGMLYERSLDLIFNEVIGNAQAEFYTGPYAECLVATWTHEGNLTVGANPFPVITPRGGLKGWIVRGYLETPSAGADVIIDIHYDGATIFTDQSHRLVIPAGQSGPYQTKYIDVSDYADNKIISMHIDQKGSTTAGANLIVELICKARI